MQVSAIDPVQLAGVLDGVAPDRLHVGGLGRVDGDRFGGWFSEKLEGRDAIGGGSAGRKARAENAVGAGPAGPYVTGRIASERGILLDEASARWQRLRIGPLQAVEASEVILLGVVEQH